MSSQENRGTVTGGPSPEGEMWNSPKVGEWTERTTGKVLTRKKQRGWEYGKKPKQSLKVPRPHNDGQLRAFANREV